LGQRYPLQQKQKGAEEETKGGTPGKKPEVKFGPYEWVTYGEVDHMSEMAARAIRKLNFSPVIIGEEKEQRFLGIWAKNCTNWLITLLATMKARTSVIGFYDAMGNEAVDYIIRQTELTTVFCTGDYIAKLISMKKDGLAAAVTSLVSFDDVPADLVEQGASVGIQVHSWTGLLNDMESATDVALEDSIVSDTYMFSYTSGTTGDSKGVKLTHKNIISSVDYVIPKFTTTGDNCVISYLPLPHSFEQCMLGYALISGAKIGYYQGNPLKLVEDCAALQPTVFPSVPRLYNRIYASIQ